MRVMTMLRFTLAFWTGVMVGMGVSDMVGWGYDPLTPPTDGFPGWMLVVVLSLMGSLRLWYEAEARWWGRGPMLRKAFSLAKDAEFNYRYQTPRESDLVYELQEENAGLSQAEARCAAAWLCGRRDTRWEAAALRGGRPLGWPR